MAFYGTGGTEDEMKTALTAPKYRPIGHDCNTQGTLVLISIHTIKVKIFFL